jgi:hypothetical protein
VSDDEFVLRAGIGELVSTFRDALLAVVPFADRVELGHEDEEMHHDWEKLASCMFDVFVRSPISVDRGRDLTDHPLARYDIDRDDYVEASWLGVRPDAAFVRFWSVAAPFDAVEVAVLDGDLRVVERTSLPWGGLSFTYHRRGPTRSETIEEITTYD